MIDWIKARWNEFINRPRVVEHATVNFAVIENWEVPRHEVQLLEPVKVPQVDARKATAKMLEKFDKERERVLAQFAEAKTTGEQAQLERVLLDDEWKRELLDLLTRVLEK